MCLCVCGGGGGGILTKLAVLANMAQIINDGVQSQSVYAIFM